MSLCPHDLAQRDMPCPYRGCHAFISESITRARIYFALPSSFLRYEPPEIAETRHEARRMVGEFTDVVTWAPEGAEL